MMNIGVTGANGYVGGKIVKYFKRLNHTVYELKRKSQAQNDPFWIPYDLSVEIPEGNLKKVDVLIHCAYDFRPAHWDEISRINIEGSRRLFEIAARSGIKKVVFVSSMSAFEGAKSMYGKAKLEIEGIAQKYGFPVVRPGLVFGNPSGGMVGGLLQMIEKSKVIPLIRGGKQPFYLCHDEDLCRLIEYCIQNSAGSKPMIAANDQKIYFYEVLNTLAAFKRKKILFIPFPAAPIYFGIKTLETFGVKTRMRSDGLVSLLNQNQSLDFGATQKTGVHFRPFNSQTLN